MKRKDFLKDGMLGLGTIIGLPTAMSSCKSDKVEDTNDDCPRSPRETVGPYPIKSPADLVKENIISDRKGVPLLVNLTIHNKNDCAPLSGALVDIWQCDSVGNYSEYGEYRDQNFLRGRQSTDGKGQVSFISIYPGWYRGRAPHLHIEVFDKNEKSLLVTQIAFPDDISEVVYATSQYRGSADTSNSRDFIFRNSLDGNMADTIEGNTTDGYTLSKVITV